MIILNELKYAKYVYDNKILDDKPSFTISLLCKYFIQVLNMSEMETVIAIDNFMKETYPLLEYYENKGNLLKIKVDDITTEDIFDEIKKVIK